MFTLAVDGLDGWVPANLDLDEATLRDDLAEDVGLSPDIMFWIRPPTVRAWCS